MRHFTWCDERRLYRLDDDLAVKSAVSVGLGFDPGKQRCAILGNNCNGCSMPVVGSAESFRRRNSAVALGSQLLRTRLHSRGCNPWKAGSFMGARFSVLSRTSTLALECSVRLRIAGFQ